MQCTVVWDVGVYLAITMAIPYSDLCFLNIKSLPKTAGPKKTQLGILQQWACLILLSVLTKSVMQ